MSRGSETSFPASCFSIRASNDPGALPRILAVFARRSVAISAIHARSLGDSGGNAINVQAIDIQAEALAQDRLELIADALRQIVDVERVLTAQKRVAEVA